MMAHALRDDTRSQRVVPEIIPHSGRSVWPAVAVNVPKSQRQMSTDTILETLGNGVRIVILPSPHRATASVSIFVRSGSEHESARLNGISHVIEHMAFKGTRTRNCQQINLDAERLGAEVNAHTDKDHTAFHMRGHPRDAATFIEMMGEIVQHSIFPDDELTRERQVLLHEYAEDEDDGLETAFRLFDKSCFGDHPAAQPVIGTRANLERFTRDDIVSFVQSRYTGANTIVGVAGDIDPRQIVDVARATFGGMAQGEPNRIVAPQFMGGIRSKKLTGTDQVHVVLGFPVPVLTEEHDAFTVAAALFGEGMSSPFLDRVRERRGLVYHADCFTDVRDAYGQFVVEASTTLQQLDEFLGETTRLLRQQANVIDSVDFERARNQLTVRKLFVQDAPEERVERAAIDLFALGRFRSQEELLAGITGIDSAQVRAAFGQMLGTSAAVGVAGNIGKRIEERVARIAMDHGIAIAR